MDVCIVKGLDYRETVVNALQGRTSRPLNEKKVQDAIQAFLKRHGVPIHWCQFIHGGTREIDKIKLPADMEEVMNKQRRELGIGALAERDRMIPPTSKFMIKVGSIQHRRT